MAKSLWKGSISFGLVNIPIDLVIRRASKKATAKKRPRRAA